MAITQRYLAVIALAASALLVAACTSTAPEVGYQPTPALGFTKNADGYAEITVQQLAGMLEDKDLTLVNVHIPYEGELPDTDLFIPFNEIGDHLDLLPNKEAPIVLYCRSGGMSTAAARELAALGYINVLELEGGFNAWKAAGFELLNKQ